MLNNHKVRSINLQVNAKLSSLSRADLFRFKKIARKVSKVVINYLSSHVASLKFLSNSRIFIDLLVTNNNIIQLYNNKLRNIDKPTNVISVQFFTNDELFINNYNNIIHVGEIIVSIQKVFEEAKHYNISNEAHFARVVIHGILHLLGYDHNNDILASEMLNIERKLLKKSGYIVESLVHNYFIVED